MWGEYGKSKRLRLSNGISNWGSGAVPVNVPIQQTGILEELRIIMQGTAVTLGGGTAPTLDNLGPWNIFNLITLSPNQQAPIVQLSGYGMYLANLMRTWERGGPGSPDTTVITPTSADPNTDTYLVATSGSPFIFSEDVPLTTRVKDFGGLIGYWPLQNPAVQLALQYTPNAANSASPYNIYNATAGAGVFTGGATSPTATITTPTVDVVRNLWEVPAAPADYPPFNLVSTWIEESPQGVNTNSATKAVWQATPLTGLLVRLGAFIYDNGAGVAVSKLGNSNSLTLTTDASTPKFSESGVEALVRQKEFYRFNLPQGAYVYDFLGRDLTLADVIDTNTTANIQLTMNFSSALSSSNTFIKIIRQIISPLEVR